MKAFLKSHIQELVYSIGLGAVLLASWFAFTNSLEISRSSTARIDLSKTRFYLEAAVVSLLEAESGQRGYLLTHDETYLDPFIDAKARFSTAVLELHRRFAANSDQLARLKILESLASAKLKELEHTVALERKGNTKDALSVVKGNSGRELMDQIRALTAQMREDSESDWTEQTLLSNSHIRYANIIALITGILGSMLVLGTFSYSRRQDRIRAQAEDRLEQFFGVTLDLLCIAGTDGYFKKMNPAWQGVLGFSPEELCSRPLMEFVHPDDRERTVSEIERQAGGNRVLAFENRYLCKDGSYKWLSWKSTPVGNTMYAAARDITETRQLEASQRTDAERLNSIINLQYEVAAGGTDIEHIMSLVVARAEEITGASGAVVEMADGDEMVYRAASGSASGQIGMRLKRSTSLSGKCLSTGEVLVCEDAVVDPRVDRAACEKVGVRSMVVVPLRHHQKAIGVLKVYSNKAHAFDEKHKASLELMSGFLGIMLERVGHLEALAKSESEFRILNAGLEQRVEERSRDLNLIAENIPQLIWQADSSGKGTYVNSRWTDYLGKGLDSKFEDIVHPDDFKRTIEEWEKALKSGSEFQIEYRLKSKLGDFRWFFVRGTPTFDSNGRVEKWFGTCTDIHETKVIRDELLVERQRNQVILQNAPFVLWAINTKGEFTFYDGQGAAALGINAKDRIGKNIFEINSERPDVLNGIRNAMKGESNTHVLPYSGRWLENTYTPLYSSENKISGVVGFSVDVTEKRRLETQHLATFNQSAVGIVYGTREAKWFKFNKRFCEITGYSEEELLKTSFQEISHPDDLEKEAASIAEFLSGKLKSLTREKRYIKKDGSIVWINLTTTAVQDIEGRIEYFISFAEDISARKAAELEAQSMEVRERSAQAASRLKSEFLANMSHEIRTPINGVMGMANILLDTELSEEQKEYTQNIQRSADTLLTIVNDILDLSKAEAGKVELEMIDFELEQVLHDVERTLSFAAKKKELKLMRFLAPGLPRFFNGDPTRLRQVLMNLANNAIKFTAKGHVKISVSGNLVSAGKYALRFDVEDSGIGIPEAALSRMFQAFSQADASTTRRYGGTGLGLSISKKLVNLMGGEIGVNSTEGAGSTFWFTLNLATAKGVESPISKTKITKSPVKLRVLLAEDNSVNQLIAKKMLKKMGHSIVVAANGNEAIDALRVAPYDLILMDCQMPDMDGYEATKVIRTSPSLGCSKIKIIAMTANAMSGDREKCIAVGMDEYISKPIKASELQAVIERVCSDLLLTG